MILQRMYCYLFLVEFVALISVIITCIVFIAIISKINIMSISKCWTIARMRIYRITIFLFCTLNSMS